MDVRSRLVQGVLVGGLVLGGGGAVLAAADDSGGGSTARDQYCPPNSPNGGQPQGGPDNNCGHPPDTCPDGSPKPPPGNCGHGDGNGGGKPGSQDEKPAKGPKPRKKGGKPKFTVKVRPARGCVKGTYVARVSVANMPVGGKVRVYRDGRPVKVSGRASFKVSVNARNLRPGIHRIQLRVRGADGKVRTRTLRFRRC